MEKETFRKHLYIQDTMSGVIYKITGYNGTDYGCIKPLGENATFTNHVVSMTEHNFRSFWLQSGDRLRGKNASNEELILEVVEISNFELSKSVGLLISIISVNGKWVNKRKWIEEKDLAKAELL